MGKELFTEELKLAVVQYVLEGHTRRETSEKFCVSCTPIEKWVNLYKIHGTKGLLSCNDVGRQKGFDGEFRLKVLQYKQEHNLSCTQTTRHSCKTAENTGPGRTKARKQASGRRESSASHGEGYHQVFPVWPEAVSVSHSGYV